MVIREVSSDEPGATGHESGACKMSDWFPILKQKARARWYLCVCLLLAGQGCARVFQAQKASPTARASQGSFKLRLVASDASGGGDAAISPNGKSFVISSKRSGNVDLWLHDIETSKWTRLTTDPADDFEAQWSPDGQRLVYTSTKSGNKDICLLSLTERTVTQLTNAPDDDEYPNWSPDGQTIVYTGGPWEGRDFYLISAEGGTPRKVTRKSGKAGACSFAADGQSLLCHAYDTGTGDVFRLALNGEVTPLTPEWAWDYKPTGSPDGQWVAFSRSEDGPSAIWLMPLKGGPARPLVQTRDNDRWPTWDATGHRIFFHRIAEAGTSIKVWHRATGAINTLVGADENPGQASFDPSAQRIVYGAEVAGRRVLRIRHMSDGRVRTLDTGSAEAAFPRWSPDGRRIAFVSKDARRWEVSTINADGTNLTVWTRSVPQVKGLDGVLDWSPDSTRIVFQGETNPFESDIFVIDTTTGKVSNVTNDKWFDESPAWTPDGQGLLFMSTRAGNWTWGLFRLSLTTGAVEVIAGPDYTEKNFPRPGKSGLTVWSMYDEDGVEYLAERAAKGRVEVLKRAGKGARWPSYAANGQRVIFTTLTRRVEYWIAENVWAADSPIMRQETSDATRPAEHLCPAEPAKAVDAIAFSPGAVAISPVKFFGR